MALSLSLSLSLSFVSPLLSFSLVSVQVPGSGRAPITVLPTTSAHRQQHNEKIHTAAAAQQTQWGGLVYICIYMYVYIYSVPVVERCTRSISAFSVQRCITQRPAQGRRTLRLLIDIAARIKQPAVIIMQKRCGKIKRKEKMLLEDSGIIIKLELSTE